MKIFLPLLMALAFLHAAPPTQTTVLKTATPHVVFETTQGVLEFKLFDDIAPKAVENFTTHVKNGYYNGLIFHRIIKDFMIQGGDPTGT